MNWICKETATGACDGVYTSEEEAERMANYFEDEWNGSQWLVVRATPGIMRGRFWRLQKILGDLEEKYGLSKTWSSPEAPKRNWRQHI